MAKIEMKIGRYIREVGKNDLVLDNGCCIQVTTQLTNWHGWSASPLLMSKKLFKELKKNDCIYEDKDLTKKANEGYEKPFLKYYRFNIDMLQQNGYALKE